MSSLSKFFMNIPLFLYEKTNGKIGGQMGKFKVLILTTKGRKSGKMHITPVGYFEHDGGYLVVASNAGRAGNPDWYYNIQGNPNAVSIQVMDRKMKVSAQIILGEPRRPLYDWIASIAPNFGEYEKKTAREIPLVFLKPQ